MNLCSAVLAGALLLLALGGGTAYGQAPRLINISTRMQVLTGDNVMIGGFVIGGSSPKTVAIVATGPSLSAYGISDPLANPTLTLVRASDQQVIGLNDDWQSAGNAAQLQAAGFAPSSPLESALLVSLPPGAYTAIVRGVNDATGVGVVAVYEMDAPTVPLVNISTRGRVSTGNDVMIGGFVIQGSAPQNVAIVAAGPSLSAYGIANPLANPRLTLVRASDQAVIASNDNWPSDANGTMLARVGLAPTHGLESGLFITLQPGAYTAIVSGADNGTGVSVLGVYKPPMVALFSQPAHTAQNISVNMPVTVTFSGLVDPATISGSTFSLTGPNGPVAGTLSTDGFTVTFTPGAPLLTEASYTAMVTTGVRDLSGSPIGSNLSFTFSTANTEPPPIVAGCPAPAAGAEVRRFEWGETRIVKRPSGAVTSYRVMQSPTGRASVSFVQGQTTFTPGSTYTEITISRCPGVIEPNLHPSCRLESVQALNNSVTAYNRLPPGYANQQQLGSLGCYAPDTEQHYVNVRWTYPACNNPEGCGFSHQWLEGGQ
jgi:hypothetical protein